MKVVILCGGLGTRLREETEYRPKPMVEIGGKPILWHIMKLYSAHGFSDFILCLGYKQNIIREYFLNYEYMNNDFTINLTSKEKTAYHNTHNENWNITFVDTGFDSKKGTRVKRIEPYIKEDRFMLTYGDGVGNINIKELLDYHQRKKKITTFTGVRPVSRFATIELNEEGEVGSWKEKRRIDEYINAGFFVFEKEIFRHLDEDCELEEGPMEHLSKERQVMMYKHEGFWHCMDTYRDYMYLQKLWNSGNPPWKAWKD